MRIVSWMVVIASVSALAWKGIGTLEGGFSLPQVDVAQVGGAVGGASPDRVFTGSASRNTAEFEVEAPWLLDWRVTSLGGYELAVDVSLEAAGTGIHQGSVLKTKQAGNGVRLFDQSGRFYFRVNSSFAKWALKVRELTPEEAATFTPVN